VVLISFERADLARQNMTTSENSLPADISKIGESDVFFRNLLESAPDAMIIVNEKGEIALVNGQALHMFGYERSEMIGASVDALLPEDLRQTHVAHRVSYGGSPTLRPMGQDIDLVGLRKDGSEFPVEISLSPVETHGGKYISSVVRDVSVRRQMEIDIKAAREAAERANNANSAFLAAASHDLRQPVQALSLLNGALRRTVKDERALQMVENQDASLMAMTNLLNSLLDISRLDAGAVKPEWEEFPMQRLIDRFSAEFGRQAHSKGIAFSSESCDAVVRSDPNLLAEVITNLVSNAIRYTDKGEVKMVCVERDGHCHLEVSDTGIGIEADQLDEIFREFHQCKSKGASKEGFGLGLAIVRRLTDLLDHRIEVRSDIGRGSCFTVTVPIIVGGAANETDVESGVRTPREEASGLVVLIEDDVNVADAWELLLEAEGYRVATAASATETVALLKHLDEQPVLVISDFHLLDGSTGVEAVSLIRDFYESEIPAFIVSGDTSKVVKESRLLDNCTLMCKPVDTARLLSAAQIASRSGIVPED
jgi:PAS domain S-box-containing protein